MTDTQIVFESAREVMTNPLVPSETHTIYMKVQSVTCTPIKGYRVKITYFYEEEQTQEQIDNGEPVVKVDIQNVFVDFSLQDVINIEIASGGLTGDNFNDKFNDLIVKAALIRLQAAPVFGLAGNEWQLLTTNN